MRELTATEAARRFSEVLDAVEHRGAAFVITRQGQPVARIEAPPRANGTAALSALEALRVDDTWADEMDHVLRWVREEQRG